MGGAAGGKEVGSEADSHWSGGAAVRTLEVGRLAWTAYFWFLMFLQCQIPLYAVGKTI